MLLFAHDRLACALLNSALAKTLDTAVGYRLSKIYTRTGDEGTTGLGDGSRRRKSSSRVVAMGEVDELNSHLGLLISFLGEASHREFLLTQQHRLFDLGGEISIPESVLIKPEHTLDVEQQIDRMNQILPPLENFILPGGSTEIAHIHVCRAVCRRVERCLVDLDEQETLNPEAICYINRLSDYLFVLARSVAAATGCAEILWEPGR